MLNSLSQTLLKITSPGVPDFYQGSELWDLRLVDPDNRGPVDFGKRRSFLQSLCETDAGQAELIDELIAKKENGAIKLFLILRALLTRKHHPGLFQNGVYLPLDSSGKFREHVVSFARSRHQEWMLVIVPRWCASLLQERQILPLGEEVWQDTAVQLPENAPRTWVDAFSGATLAAEDSLQVGKALLRFPAILLTGKEE
jgi:(1->4)-alpha-D-glucan 1-alpha-D-glucosylmutase